MLPSASGLHGMNSTNAHPVGLGYFGQSSATVTDCGNVLFGKLRCVVRRAARPLREVAAPLLKHVMHVGRLAAAKQVSRIKTGAIVATVEDALAARDGANESQKRDAMRGKKNSLSIFPVRQLPVSGLGVDRSRPSPAPHLLRKVGRRRLDPALGRAVDFDGRAGLERRAANRAVPANDARL